MRPCSSAPAPSGITTTADGGEPGLGVGPGRDPPAPRRAVRRAAAPASPRGRRSPARRRPATASFIVRLPDSLSDAAIGAPAARTVLIRVTEWNAERYHAPVRSPAGVGPQGPGPAAASRARARARPRAAAPGRVTGEIAGRVPGGRRRRPRSLAGDAGRRRATWLREPRARRGGSCSADGAALPFRRAFDAVFSGATFHWIHDHARALSIDRHRAQAGRTARRAVRRRAEPGAAARPRRAADAASRASRRIFDDWTEPTLLQRRRVDGRAHARGRVRRRRDVARSSAHAVRLAESTFQEFIADGVRRVITSRGCRPATGRRSCAS